MVVIVKGEEKRKVALSAYKNFYKHAGWHIEQELGKSKSKEKSLVDNDQDIDGTDNEESDDEWDDVINEEDDEPTKPLSSMNREELEVMANELGVSLAGLSTNKQIREAIKAVMQ